MRSVFSSVEELYYVSLSNIYIYKVADITNNILERAKVDRIIFLMRLELRGNIVYKIFHLLAKIPNRFSENPRARL